MYSTEQCSTLGVGPLKVVGANVSTLALASRCTRPHEAPSLVIQCGLQLPLCPCCLLQVDDDGWEEVPQDDESDGLEDDVMDDGIPPQRQQQQRNGYSRQQQEKQQEEEDPGGEKQRRRVSVLQRLGVDGS